MKHVLTFVVLGLLLANCVHAQGLVEGRKPFQSSRSVGVGLSQEDKLTKLQLDLIRAQAHARMPITTPLAPKCFDTVGGPGFACYSNPQFFTVGYQSFVQEGWDSGTRRMLRR